MLKFFAFMLLFASIDLCLSQRKVSRNVQVGADVKTINNFACPEEFGYYPHPNDCTQYYVCVYGGALLESCTGGLMYSHELQTCDWPRNVGCDGDDISSAPAATSSSSSNNNNNSPQQQSRQRYTPPTPPPVQPAAIVTSRGQPRQLHHNQQEIIKQRQQQQLYADAEEALPPAEEIESDRQQRVYRGQPSTIGQVQKDRDGLRHTNAISSYSPRGERIGVISFGTGNQQSQQPKQQYRVEQSSASPVQISTARTLYNTTQYNTNSNNNNNYDPYYAIYDDDVELYKDVDYAQHYNSNNNNNNNNNNNAQQQQQSGYRRTPAPAIQSTTQQQQIIQNNYNQDLYQPSTVQDYSDDNSYNSQVEVDDQNSYRQINRQPSRGDRNNLNYIEEATTKRITTTTTTTFKPTSTTTSPTTPRTNPPKKSTIIPSQAVTTEKEKTHNDPGQNNNPFFSSFSSASSSVDSNRTNTVTYRPFIDLTLLQNQNSVINNNNNNNNQNNAAAVVNKPAPFTLPDHLTITKTIQPTTDKPIVFHYISTTKSSRSTSLVSSNSQQQENLNDSKTSSTIIVPTTYSPPKFFLKGLLPKFLSSFTSARKNNHNPSYTNNQNNNNDNIENDEQKPKVKFVRKLISPLNVNYGLSSLSGPVSFESAEKFVSDVDVVNIKELLSSSAAPSSSTTTTTKTTTEQEPIVHQNQQQPIIYVDERKRYRTTVEVPPQITSDEYYYNDDYKPKVEPDQLPDYKLKPNPKPITTTTTTTTTIITKPTITTTTTIDIPQNTSIPPSSTIRISRVNNAIKSMIAYGSGTRRNKCFDADSDVKCTTEPKQQRNNIRGRGSTHYVSAPNVANNEVTVTVNRGTPPSRSRPTLKPSTSIVSKASEFIDIYRFPPNRPDPIYPQPQPDKTAAKCRKDVCLLPDCSCGGKEIPGDIPVEQVPQVVLLTFDDSVNDLNKGLYSDLFEKGRTNPNGCPISATFYVSHEWTDYSQVQNLYSDGHEIASHTVSHSFGEQFSQKKWTREVAGQREILSAYGGVRLEDVRGMRAPFLSVGGNKMFKMLYDSNFTYDSSMPIYENKPPSWPYTLDYKLFHDCMIPPCPTRSYPGVWEVPMVMWQDLNGGRCSMGDACSNPPDSDGVFKMLTKNFQRHYTTNRAPFGLFYHAAWFTQPHHKEGFIQFLDSILEMKDVWLITNWQAIQWIRDPTPTSRLGSFQPFQCEYSHRPKRCNNPKVCNLWHKSGVRYMRTCQPCPDIYPWTGNTGIRSSRIDNDIED